MYTKGDFHMHSVASDGDSTPSEIIVMAKEKGLDIIAITDHNSTDSVDEAKRLGEILGIKVIAGLELSTRYKGKKVHVLSYFMNDKYKDITFQKVLKHIRNHEIEELKSLIGSEIEITRDGIKNRIDTKTGIDILRHFGGCVVLAHPVKVKKEIREDILKLDFDGIEAIYSKNTIEDTKNFKAIAEKKGWFYTAGSDFHTDKRLDSRHGQIGQVFLTEKELEIFIKHL
ncbi:PHP domain-containing protein [Clostridium sp. YIM B02505]|uniref:PHP domain-containing protein n=1 Tax=Clostridium yunnanense TaxID=2800325 RepID=A0ABS1EKV8_9CLOT|nr:PHP domain-containing protein [Clostridium yunnanense]MBK1809996.1 PHP domain-containing protein [Clostridium yunnanense]